MYRLMQEAILQGHGERTNVVNDLHSSTSGSQQTASAMVHTKCTECKKTQHRQRKGLTESVMFLALKKICTPTASLSVCVGKSHLNLSNG